MFCAGAYVYHIDHATGRAVMHGRDRINVRNLETGEPLDALQNYGASVGRAGAFMPGVRAIVSGGNDGTVRLWEIQQ